MPELSTIGFDADDTLWHHERYFVAAKERFAELLSPFADPARAEEVLHATEIGNVRHYGFGIKSFTLSMVEAAIAVSGRDLPNRVFSTIIEIGREMLVHPVDPFPGVIETLEALKPTHKLLVVTRGDLFDQERKLAASGLARYFSEVEIVSDKTAPIYRRIFSRHGDGPERAMMIGNSMRADVIPALEAGTWAVHVPSEHVWDLDLHADPADKSRFRRFPALADIVPLVEEIG